MTQGKKSGAAMDGRGAKTDTDSHHWNRAMERKVFYRNKFLIQNRKLATKTPAQKLNLL